MKTAIDIYNVLQAARLDAPRRSDLGGTGRSWWVYGAGKMGRKVAKALLASGRLVEGFIDPAKQGVFDGLECVGIDSALSRLGAQAPVALGLHNPMVDATRVKAKLMASGFESVWMPQELVEALPSVSNFWLAPIASVDALDRQGIERAMACYGDQASLDAIEAIARWRWLSDASGLPEPDAFGQYMPKGLYDLPASLRMIDCGAYTGDTLEALQNRGFEFETYVGLEPDPSNYERLVKKTRMAGPVCIALPCGAWSDARMLSFVPDDAAGSVMKGDQANALAGSVGIQTLSIDEAFYGLRPNFIKMDIEGAESEALLGAADCIADFQPNLAISSYHHPMDLWLLPIQIKSLMMRGGAQGQHLALRCHAMASFDSVIYAWR
jgi:FkbM family methyltransferase